jgi:hypothetical protein
VEFGPFLDLAGPRVDKLGLREKQADHLAVFGEVLLDPARDEKTPVRQA